MKSEIYKKFKKAIAAVLAVSILPAGAVSAAAENAGKLDALNNRGFSTHFMTGNTADDMEILKNAGVRIVRDEVGWSMIEHSDGVYKFEDFNTTYPTTLAAQGIDMILVLDYSNSLHVSGAIDNDAERNAFADYCVAVAKQYPQINKFEVWNEPNLWYDWGWNSDPTDYVKLLKTASNAIRSVNPNATILGGSLSDYSGIEQYISDFYSQSDLYSSADAVSIHPYWYYTTTPQSLFESRLRLHNKSIAAIGGFKDLYVTEIGFPSYTDENASDPYPKSISEDEQAEKLIKSYVLADHYNVSGTMLYDFKNDGTDAAEKEYNFGAINQDGTPKKAYNAVKEMNSRISGATYMGTLIPKPHRSSIHTSTDIHIYNVDGTPVAMAWYSNEDNPEKTLNYNFGEAVDVYDLYGNKLQTAVSSVELTKDPVYIYGLSKAEMYQAAKDLAADFASSAVTAAASLSGDSASNVSDRVKEINTMVSGEVSDSVSAKKIFNAISELGEDISMAYIGGELGTDEKAIGTLLDAMSDTAMEIMKIYADTEQGEYHSVNSAAEIAEIESGVANSNSAVSKAILKRAKNYSEKADVINQISGLETGSGMVKAMDLHSSGLAKWASILGYDGAELNIDGSFDENGYLTIRGNTGMEKSHVSLYVLKPSADGKISPDGIDYIDQISNGDKKYFVKKYLSSGEKGTYKIVAYSDSMGEIKSTYVDFFVTDDILSLAKRLKAASSASEAAKIMTTADENGNMASDILSSFSAICKQAINDSMSLAEFGEFMYNRRAEIDENNSDSFTELANNIAVLCAMNAAQSSSMGKAVESYASLLGFKQLNAYTTYTSAQNFVKNAICAKLSQHSFDSAEKWCTAFSEDVILTAIEKSDYTNIYSILSVNNDKLGISFDAYNALSEQQKQKAMMNFSGKSYSSYSAVKSSFDSAVADAKNSSQQSGGGSTGGGGSSGSGAAGSADISVTPSGNNTNFSDLKDYEWAEDDIKKLASLGIVNGINGSEFAPAANVKREEFVKMVVLALDLSDDTASADFDDLDKSAWYYRYIAAAFKAGMISGESERVFGINNNITREQMAAVIYRAAKLKNISFGEDGKDFADSELIDEYAAEAVKALSASGIISGYEDGTFKPHDNATRAEAAAIISRVYNLK